MVQSWTNCMYMMWPLHCTCLNEDYLWFQAFAANGYTPAPYKPAVGSHGNNHGPSRPSYPGPRHRWVCIRNYLTVRSAFVKAMEALAGQELPSHTVLRLRSFTYNYISRKYIHRYLFIHNILCAHCYMKRQQIMLVHILCDGHMNPCLWLASHTGAPTNPAGCLAIMGPLP